MLSKLKMSPHAWNRVSLTNNANGLHLISNSNFALCLGIALKLTLTKHVLSVSHQKSIAPWKSHAMLLDAVM